MSEASVTTMVFTLNEEANLPACLASLEWCHDVIVVDSFSTDRTCEISKAYGARFFQNRFEGFGTQRNWALNNTSPRNEWILILDADERVPAGLARELLLQAREAPENVGAYRMRRRFHMWGRWLRHSSLYPTWVVRFVRLGRIRYEDRGHAETQHVSGAILELQEDLHDENLKGIEAWFERQNRYSSRDAEFELAAGPLLAIDLFGRDALARRAALKRLASRMPARGWIYFVYSYLLRGGFLDGRDGLVFCRMKALYQEEVAIKVHDLRRRVSSAPSKPRQKV
jgi:glycosyltransferase involved in cell wall biosynthesis